MRPIAYSYARFSSRKQANGSSLYRQTGDTAAGESPERWCERNKVTLDTTLLFRDLGSSAYRGHKQKELLAFIDMIKSKRIRPGCTSLAIIRFPCPAPYLHPTGGKVG